LGDVDDHWRRSLLRILPGGQVNTHTVTI
jgi:hypothetical protein